MPKATKTLIQCDFDGTVAEEDVSFMLLDAFADGDWQQLFKAYQEKEITVGRFNAGAFAMVKADRPSLLAVVKGKVKIRAGFQKLVEFCHGRDFRLVIVSNGLDFYIEEVLNDAGLGDIEVFAAHTRFQSDGLQVHYIGPDGKPLDDGFKGTYTNLFLSEGYRIVYVGNGDSDVAPASQCHQVFATGVLPNLCQQHNLDCTPFTDFNQIISFLENW